MNRNELDRAELKQTAIDRILATEEELVPSSGFLASVMERVQEEAAAPPPIPIPWKIAIPGMLLAGSVLGWGGYEILRQGISAARALTFTPPHLAAGLVQPIEQTAWVAMALGVSLLSWLLSRRLVGRSGLL
jgi:hypothetical protein